MNINSVTRTVYLLYTQIILRRKLKQIGKKSIVFAPMQLDGIHNISIGECSFVGEKAWLYTNKESEKSDLRIGKNVTIGHFAHIVAWENVSIEDYVLIADKVFISDCTHEYEAIHTPISLQNIKVLEKVKIGMGSWIGENACIIGASVGKHCVIAANSVVTHNIPDYCVAAGAPAKVIKRFNVKTQKWERV